jgi:hypothetical protein
MALLPKQKILRLFQLADRTRIAQKRGAYLEKATQLLFGAVPGVEVVGKNIRHTANTEETDTVFWNERIPRRGFYFLDVPFLAECKNWKRKVSGREIVYFANTMQGRCCRDGILIAAHGITGRPGTLTQAHYEISIALHKGQRILVITRQEIETLSTSDDLIALLKLKVLEVTLKGTKIT